MGREFLPKLDEGTIVMAMVRLPSVSLEQATLQSRQLEKVLKTFPKSRVSSMLSAPGAPRLRWTRWAST